MQVLAGEWAIYQNVLWIMTDYMGKVSSWELLRTFLRVTLKTEKMRKLGKKRKKLMFWGGFEPSLPVTLNIEVTRSAYWAIEADDEWEKKFWKSFHISFVSNQFIWPSSNEFCNCEGGCSNKIELSKLFFRFWPKMLWNCVLKVAKSA